MASSAELAILVRADDQASKHLKEIADNTEHVGIKAGAASAVFSKALDLMFDATKAVAGGIASVVSSAADYESKLSAIQAVTGATAEEMADMSKLALQLGKDTSFSAGEAADAIGELAKGGVGLADIMGGAAAATLNLAAAAGEPVAEAAALAANAMAVFNLEGSKTAMVADQIAGFANATTGSMTDFKFALSSVGAVAAMSGQEFEQTATAIGLMGKAGILGSDAGTSLKTMLLNLIPTTANASTAFANLGLMVADAEKYMLALKVRGIDATNMSLEDMGQALFKSVTGWTENTAITEKQAKAWAKFNEEANLTTNLLIDAEGNFKDLRDIAELLHQGISELTEADAQLNLELAFGQDAVRAAGILAKAGAEGFDAMAEAMGKVSAEAVAATRLDNLKGAMEALNGSMDTLKITIGLALLPALTELVKVGTQFLNEFVLPFAEDHGPAIAAAASEMAEAIKVFAMALGEFVQEHGPAVLEVIGSLGPAFEEAGQSANGLAQIIETAINGDVRSAFDQLGKVVQETIGTMVATIVDSGPEIGKALADYVQFFLDFIEDARNTAVAGLLELVGAMADSISQNAPILVNAVLTEWVPALTAWVLGTALPELMGQLFSLIGTVAEWLVSGGAIQITEAAIHLGIALNLGVLQGVEALVGMLIAWFQEKIPQVIAVVQSGVADEGGLIGKAMADGLLNGAANTLNAGVGRLGQAVTNIIDTVKRDFLRSESPSKETEEKWGKPMGEGLIFGAVDEIEDGADEIGGAVDDLIKNIRPKMEAVGSVFDGLNPDLLAFKEHMKDLKTEMQGVAPSAQTLEERFTALRPQITNSTTAAAALALAMGNLEDEADDAGTEIDDLGGKVSGLGGPNGLFKVATEKVDALRTGIMGLAGAAENAKGKVSGLNDLFKIGTEILDEHGNVINGITFEWHAANEAAKAYRDTVSNFPTPTPPSPSLPGPNPPGAPPSVPGVPNPPGNTIPPAEQPQQHQHPMYVINSLNQKVPVGTYTHSHTDATQGHEHAGEGLGPSTAANSAVPGGGGGGFPAGNVHGAIIGSAATQLGYLAPGYGQYIGSQLSSHLSGTQLPHIATSAIGGALSGTIGITLGQVMEAIAALYGIEIPRLPSGLLTFDQWNQNVLSGVPGFATGGNVFRVGEQGPEIVSITPLSGGSGGMRLSREDARMLAEEMVMAQQRHGLTATIAPGDLNRHLVSNTLDGTLPFELSRV